MDNLKLFLISLAIIFVTGCAITGPVASTKDGAVTASALTLTSGIEGAWDIVSVSQRGINPVTGAYDGEYASKVMIVPKNALGGEVIKGMVAAGGQIGAAVLLPGVRSRNNSYSNFAPSFDVSPQSGSYAGSESGLTNTVNTRTILD